jgi:hypothetical protein
MTVETSSIHSSSLGRLLSGTGSETPVPRLSKQRTLANFPIRSKYAAIVGSSHMASQFVIQFVTKTSGTEPEPKSW